MVVTTLNILLLILLVLAAILCIFGPVTALGVMFWHWHKELKETFPFARSQNYANQVTADTYRLSRLKQPQDHQATLATSGRCISVLR